MPEYKWSISIYHGDSPLNLRPDGEDIPALSCSMVHDMKCLTVADPFLLVHNGKWYMFFEALNGDTGRGEIAYAISDDGIKWAYSGVVLREPFHLSYPHVFEHGGTVYMVPETRQAHSIRLYAARSFPDGWELVSTLQTGAYADSTLLQHEGRWWMFSQRGLDETRIFHSESLESGWTGHASNPFWAGNRKYCRPGGRIISYDEHLLRFVQDTLVRYGANVRALRINSLTTEQVVEYEVDRSPVLAGSFRGWNALGMHRVDAMQLGKDRWIAAVDGVTYRGA